MKDFNCKKTGGICEISPHKLCEFLKKDSNGVVFVDRNRLVEAEEYADCLFLTLERYGWDYSVDYRDASIFFEERDGFLLGGVYDVPKKRRTSCHIIATPSTSSASGRWIYADGALADILDKIKGL